MRQDMKHKFVEGGGSSKLKFPRNAKIVNASDHSHGAMKEPHRMWPKEWSYDSWVNTNFGLLNRFLESRVGKPWDQVFSEICEKMDGRSFKGDHFLRWLKSAVQINCTIEDGVIYDDRHMSIHSGELYVHPETKILSKSPDKARYKYHVDNSQKVFEIDGQNFFKNDDIWYRVEMTDVPIKEKKTKRRSETYNFDLVDDQFGVVSGFTCLYDNYRQMSALRCTYGLSPKKKLWYCSKKESANSKEIEKLKKLLSTLS